MQKIDYKELLNRGRSLFKKKHHNTSEKARRDWKILVIFFTVINIVFIVLSGYMLFRINQGNIFTVSRTNPNALSTINRNDLQNIISSFDARQKRFVEIQGASPAPADPSI